MHVSDCAKGSFFFFFFLIVVTVIPKLELMARTMKTEVGLSDLSPDYTVGVSSLMFTVI